MKPTTTTQKRLVYKALLSGRTLTANEALHELGVGRLASRINELRRIGQIVGFEIETRDIHFMNSKTGRPGKCAGYVLVKMQDAL